MVENTWLSQLIFGKLLIHGTGNENGAGDVEGNSKIYLCRNLIAWKSHTKCASRDKDIDQQ